MTKTTELSVDEIAAEAIRLGRELERAAHAVSLGGNSRDAGYVSLTLRRLAERAPFDPRNDVSLSALKGIILADLKSEIVGSERRFVETHFDNLGQHGEVRDYPIYSARGEELLSVQRAFLRFMDTRAATLDRIAAERAVIRLLAS